jgi:hypothetical protein
VPTHFSQRHHDDEGQAEVEAEARAQHHASCGWRGTSMPSNWTNEAN